MGASAFPPFGDVAMQLQVEDPEDVGHLLSIRADWVTAGFFRAIDVPILAGRGFTVEETTLGGEGSRPVIIGRRLAASVFGTPTGAVGRSLGAVVFGGPMAVHVVGVVEDIIDADLRRDPYPKMYVSMPGSPRSSTTLLVRTRQPLDAVAADVRGILGDIDPNVPLGSAAGLEQLVANATVRERTFATLSALLAAIAIVLAGVGLYSVVAYTAAQRRREIGIRIAVGASSAGIMRLVLGQAALFGLGGVLLGLALSVAGGRALAGVLFGVASTDPLSLGGAAAVLLVVTIAASLVPALNAANVDPMITLESD